MFKQGNIFIDKTPLLTIISSQTCKTWCKYPLIHTVAGKLKITQFTQFFKIKDTAQKLMLSNEKITPISPDNILLHSLENGHIYLQHTKTKYNASFKITHQVVGTRH